MLIQQGLKHILIFRYMLVFEQGLMYTYFQFSLIIAYEQIVWALLGLWACKLAKIKIIGLINKHLCLFVGVKGLQGPPMGYVYFWVYVYFLVNID